MTTLVVVRLPGSSPIWPYVAAGILSPVAGLVLTSSLGRPLGMAVANAHAAVCAAVRNRRRGGGRRPAARRRHRHPLLRLRESIDWSVLKRFGLLSALGGLAGAFAYTMLDANRPPRGYCTCPRVPRHRRRRAGCALAGSPFRSPPRVWSPARCWANGSFSACHATASHAWWPPLSDSWDCGCCSNRFFCPHPLPRTPPLVSNQSWTSQIRSVGTS